MAEEGYRVILNVYDLSQGLARQLSTNLLGKPIEGIWHTGIVVYDKEYYFGGGIQHCPAGSTPYGIPIRTVELGVTHVPQDIFESYLKEITPRYTAETYSLLNHNCNNFSNEVSQFLVGRSIPDYILQLPNEVMSSPMGSLLLPMIRQLEATLRAGVVPQAPHFRAASSSSSVPPTNNAEPDCAKEERAGLNEASTMHEDITKEFAAIMASGTLRGSEAAVLATRRVMQRYGHQSAAMPQ